MSEKQTAYAITINGVIIWRTIRHTQKGAWEAFIFWRGTAREKLEAEGYVCSRIQASVVEEK